MDATENLNTLHRMQMRRKESQAREAAEITALLVDLAPEIDAIKADYASELSEIDAEIAGLESGIKTHVLHLNRTVKGEFLMAVYSKLRVTWDGKAFKKVGKPSVSIRKVT